MHSLHTGAHSNAGALHRSALQGTDLQEWDHQRRQAELTSEGGEAEGAPKWVKGHSQGGGAAGQGGETHSGVSNRERSWAAVRATEDQVLASLNREARWHPAAPTAAGRLGHREAPRS